MQNPEPTAITVPVVDAISSVLTKGETIQAVALQNDLRALWKKDSLVITNRRVIIHRPKLLGRMEFIDFLWQDVDDIHLIMKIFGATIQVSGSRTLSRGATRSFNATIDGLVKVQALQAYACAQELEEQWCEKNRVRRMEEERAKAGGVYMQSPALPAQNSAPANSVEQRLGQLMGLREQGLITDAEFESRKAQIIADI